MSTKILLVDDEQDFLDLISVNLRQHPYDVVTAANGLEALYQARKFLPDIIILDVMMDGIDGYSVCEILRRQPATREIPVIMITAAGGEMARISGLASGANEFMRKPVSPRQLVSRVEAILLTRRLQAEMAAGSGSPARPEF